MKYRILIIALVFIGLWSCKPELNEFEAKSGTADFTTYVAAGNSLTAGFTDGALYKSAQEQSYVAFLAKQFESVGRQGTFNIPFISSEDGVGTRGPALVTKMKMGYSTDCLGNTSLAPVMANPAASQAELFQLLSTSVAASGPFHNLGVPGAKVTHLLAPGYGQLNPFFGRFASSPTSSVVQEIATTQPTFFTLWIGNNDVLGYAIGGGVGDVITPIEGAPGFGFAASYEAVIGSFKQTATAGAIANIPDITSIPYFRTVPYNPIVFAEKDSLLIQFINSQYAAYNAGMQSVGLPYRINFSVGANPLIIQDNAMPIPDGVPLPKFRQMNNDELVLLSVPQDSLKCGGWGVAKPIPDQFILTKAEIENITNAVSSFNQVIAAAAQTHNLALVDVNAFMQQASTTGIKLDGVTFTAAFVTGNVFSTDGIHLTPQGNAAVANFFIDAINAKYNASVPKVIITNYSAVELP
jgi:lysophospholipase L1-like esterase